MKFFSAVLISVSLIVPAKVESQNVDVNYILKVITEIASDEYGGRETGTRGCIKAEEYVATEFKELRLLPAGENGTYYHHYTIPVSETSVKATLKIDDRTFYQGYNEDFTVMYKSSWGEAEGEIVFAGYGIYSPSKNRNDFEDLDITGKIVLIKRGAPRNETAKWLPSCIDSLKAEYCKKNGARAVLFFEPLVRTNQRILRQPVVNHLAMVSILPDFPVFSVDERVVRYIFSSAGESYYRTMGLLEVQPLSFATGRKCSLSAKGKNAEPIQTRNILGMIPGADRELKNEFVIIGGHLDHVGTDEDGKIWNGADDNASGVAVMLGVARALKNSNFKPKRSVVFVAWTGEEMGLLGSKAWCEKPTVDLNKAIVYFNLDMVAVGNGTLNMPGTGYAPEVTEFIKNNLDTFLLARINWSEGGPGGSDHNNFLYQGIPAFAGMTAGSHPDYHQPGDDPEKTDPYMLQLTGDIICQSTAKISGSADALLSAERFEHNKLKLFTFSFFNPINSQGVASLLKDRNFKTGIVKFQCTRPEDNANANFVKLIFALDSMLNNNSPRCQMSTSAYDAMMSRYSLLAAFYPQDLGNDELKMKVLSRLGYRFAIVDKNSDAVRDTVILHKLLKMSRHHGLGLILDGLDSLQILSVTTESSCPCLIINASLAELSDKVAGNIISGRHKIVFIPQKANGMETDYSAFMKLEEKTGIDNIVLSPAEFSDASLKYLQKFVKHVDNRTIDKDAKFKITGDNFYSIAVDSLQPEQ